jgi:hypothetical protein
MLSDKELEIVGEDGLHDRVGVEPGRRERVDRRRVGLPDLGGVLHVLLQERDVAVVVPEPRPGRDGRIDASAPAAPAQ